MSDEQWSEWMRWRGGSAPCIPSTFVEIRMRDHEIEDGKCSDFNWRHWGNDWDIIAYRYRLDDNTMKQEPDMHPDLEWLARNVSEWPKGCGAICRSGKGFMKCDYAMDDEEFTENQWLQARQDLGLVMTPDEEELPAKEWAGGITDVGHDAVNNPKHYQLREGYEIYDLRQDLSAKAANGGATYDQYSDWDRATEYLIRMWGKNKLEDARKARWYLDKLIGKLEAGSE